jgi:hypothetical protein
MKMLPQAASLGLVNLMALSGTLCSGKYEAPSGPRAAAHKI